MTDPATVTITQFQVTRQNSAGFPPELTVALSASGINGAGSVNALYSVTGYNL